MNKLLFHVKSPKSGYRVVVDFECKEVAALLLRPISRLLQQAGVGRVEHLTSDEYLFFVRKEKYVQ